ncbi:integrase, catalytic region, zinc finger, CCHC-type containing protein [Tanacetum coccineum]
MSTSNTHQQSLADAGSETRPLMLKRGSYIPWASHFRRYRNRKRENTKWLNKAIDEGPYEFKEFTLFEIEEPRMQTEEDLKGDDLKHYEAEIEAMNLILISIPNDIYNFVDACTTTQAMWQRVECLMRGTMQNKVDRETHFNNEFDQFVAKPGKALVSVYNCFAQLMNDLERNGIKFPKVTQFEKLVNASRAKKLEISNDPLALVAHTGSSSKTTSPYYVTHPSSVVDYDDDYKGDAVHNTFEDPLTSAMILLARAITQRFSNLTNNLLRTSSNTGNQAIVQADIVQIQSRNSVRKVIMLVIVQSQEMTFADATRMEEIEELSTNICLMARIQPANFDSDAGPSYDYAFLSKVETPSTSYVNSLFVKDNQEQSVLANTKKSSKKVEVSDRTNKKPDVASKNVALNKKIVTNVDVKNALIANDVLCVSCAKNMLIPCHDKCLANYKLNVHSNVRRALFTTPKTVKSKFEDTTPVVSKTRFSVKTTHLKSLDTTPVVSKTKIAAITPLSAKNKVVQIVLWIVNSGCSKHMTGDRMLLENFIEKFIGTVRFGNDHFAAITGYGDYVQGNITVCHVYYVEGLGHNLFRVGQYCDGDLEVAFRSKTCYVRNLEGDDLLTGARESNLYTISISEMSASLPVCLMSKATLTKSWLWHRRLSHLNFGTINDLTKHDLIDGLPKFKYGKDHLCSAYERERARNLLIHLNWFQVLIPNWN